MKLKTEPIECEFCGKSEQLTAENITALDLEAKRVKLEKPKLRLPIDGFLREKQILAPVGPIPVSRSTWWAGVKAGRFPKPTKFFGPRITAWDVRDIRALLEKAELPVDS